MRTIKFRIWNPVEKKMVESGGTPSMLSGFFHQTATLDTVHNMPYQQFTGLLDKVGKEIYEGDILRLNCGSDDGATARHKITATIEWGERGWIANIPDKIVKVKGGSMNGQMLSWREIHTWVGMHHCLTKTWVKFEIIGNIYENPELLQTP